MAAPRTPIPNAAAAPPADPVFALIEEHRAAYAEWDELDMLAREYLAGDPRLDPANATAQASSVREVAAFVAVTTARPTTLAGVLALAEYLPGAIRQASTLAEETDGERALRNLAAALRDLVPPAAPSGELVAMVEQWQDLGRQMDARPDAPGAFECLSARHTALQFAVYRFPAASVADLAAKVPVFRDELKDATDASPIEGAADTLAGSAWLGLFSDLERLSGPAAPPVRSETPDTMLAAVAASYAAEAEMRAFQDEMPDVNPPEILARESVLSDAQVDMRNAVWTTVPTTHAGRRALVDYAAFQVRLHMNGEGRVTSAEELFGEILGAMAAAVDAETVEAAAPRGGWPVGPDLSDMTVGAIAALHGLCETALSTFDALAYPLGGSAATGDHRTARLYAAREAERLRTVMGACTDALAERVPADEQERATRARVLLRHAVERGAWSDLAGLAIAEASAGTGGRP